jgi:DNA mismatch repair protein MutS
MREMTELTAILHGATEDSLVLLDEVGRGTATTDGRAIARAAVEFLHDEVGATTLFATHYHDLTTLADARDRVRNLHFRVANEGAASEDVTFLHRVAPGAASSSYGIEVARTAGVPAAVVERARALVAAGRDDPPASGPAADASPTATSRADGGADPGPAVRVAERVADMDLATTTPLEALTALHDLQRDLDEGR